MAISRRGALSLGGSLPLITFSGCTRFFSETPSLSLNLLNFDSAAHDVNVELLRVDADDYQDAVAVRERYELLAPPEEDASYEHVEEGILESDRYIVNVDLDALPATRGTYHFYPALRDEERTDRLVIEVRTERESSEPYFEFQQNH